MATIKETHVRRIEPALLLAIVTLLAPIAGAEDEMLETAGEGELSVADIQAMTQDPLADLTALVLDNAISFRTGPDNKEAYVFQAQPVHALDFTDVGFHLITRGVIPLLGSPGRVLPLLEVDGSVTDSSDSYKWGLGDSMLQLFAVPQLDLPFKIGGGPAFSFNTHTSDELKGSGWGMGPVGVLVADVGPVGGAVILGNMTSYDGDFNTGFVQPMLFYDMPFINEGMSLSYNNTISANWKESGRDRWNVPLGLTLSQLFVPSDSFAVDVGVGAYGMPARPRSSATWQLKFTIFIVKL